MVYKYVDDNNHAYTDEYRDTVECRSKEAPRARGQYIKQMIATDGQAMKILLPITGYAG